jgi:hypothetical protein
VPPREQQSGHVVFGGRRAVGRKIVHAEGGCRLLCQFSGALSALTGEGQFRLLMERPVVDGGSR